jgi:hypothetical protein
MARAAAVKTAGEAQGRRAGASDWVGRRRRHGSSMLTQVHASNLPTREAPSSNQRRLVTSLFPLACFCSSWPCSMRMRNTRSPARSKRPLSTPSICFMLVPKAMQAGGMGKRNAEIADAEMQKMNAPFWVNPRAASRYGRGMAVKGSGATRCALVAATLRLLLALCPTPTGGCRSRAGC